MKKFLSLALALALAVSLCCMGASAGTITIGSQASFQNTGSVTNSGSFDCNGEFSNGDGTFTNNGSFDYNGPVNEIYPDFGTFTNSGTLTGGAGVDFDGVAQNGVKCFQIVALIPQESSTYTTPILSAYNPGTSHSFGLPERPNDLPANKVFTGWREYKDGQEIGEILPVGTNVTVSTDLTVSSQNADAELPTYYRQYKAQCTDLSSVALTIAGAGSYFNVAVTQGSQTITPENGTYTITPGDVTVKLTPKAGYSFGPYTGDDNSPLRPVIQGKVGNGAPQTFTLYYYPSESLEHTFTVGGAANVTLTVSGTDTLYSEVSSGSLSGHLTGRIKLAADAAVPSNATYTVDANAVLWIPPLFDSPGHRTLTLNGTLTNYGTIYNEDTITVASGGKLVNKADATVQNGYRGVAYFSIGSTAAVENSGTFYNCWCAFVNSGSFTNMTAASVFKINGSGSGGGFSNAGVIANNGTVTLENGVSIRNFVQHVGSDSGSDTYTYGTINNSGTINTPEGGTGTIENRDTYPAHGIGTFTNNGTVAPAVAVMGVDGNWGYVFVTGYDSSQRRITGILSIDCSIGQQYTIATWSLPASSQTPTSTNLWYACTLTTDGLKLVSDANLSNRTPTATLSTDSGVQFDDGFSPDSSNTIYFVMGTVLGTEGFTTYRNISQEQFEDLAGTYDAVGAQVEENGPLLYVVLTRRA